MIERVSEVVCRLFTYNDVPKVAIDGAGLCHLGWKVSKVLKVPALAAQEVLPRDKEAELCGCSIQSKVDLNCVAKLHP